MRGKKFILGLVIISFILTLFTSCGSIDVTKEMNLSTDDVTRDVLDKVAFQGNGIISKPADSADKIDNVVEPTPMPEKTEETILVEVEPEVEVELEEEIAVKPDKTPTPTPVVTSKPTTAPTPIITPEPNLEPIEEKDTAKKEDINDTKPIIIGEEIEEVNAEDTKFSNDMQKIIDTAVKNNKIKNKVGIYIKEFSNNLEFGVNDTLTVVDSSDGNTDGYFRAASVVKLQMAYITYQLIEDGTLKTDKLYHDNVTKKDFYVLQAVHTMISKSDNNLFNTFLRLVGKEKSNEILDKNGLINSNIYGEINPAIGYSSSNNLKRHGTTKVGGKITPKDMGYILEQVYTKKDTDEHMAHFNKALLDNIWNSRIPTGIKFKYPVAHKTGTASDYGVYNDAGIVYCKNPYILVVFTKGETNTSGEGFIREVAREVTNYMDSLIE